MQRKNILDYLGLGLAITVVVLLMYGMASAQSGSFVIPGIRASGGTDFAYWDLFRSPPGTSINYNYDNAPALLDTFGRDDAGNPTTAFGSRTNLRQTGTNTCFLTSSGALYSYAAPTAFEVPYTAPAGSSNEVTNVIFQSQTGGTRMDLDNIRLVYSRAIAGGGTETVSLAPVFRGLDDPQTGGFSERLISAFQWNLTGLGIRNFKITFASPDASMPLWQAQLDAVVGAPFVQELGYLLFMRARPSVRYGRPGAIDKNLPFGVDGRFFFPGESLDLLANPELDWEHVGFSYENTVVEGYDLPLIFPNHDATVTALFAPLTYSAWKDKIFFHSNSLTGSPADDLNSAVSGPTADFDGDGVINQAEYAFGGDPYTQDRQRTQPQMTTVTVAGVVYPAVRYRTNGAPSDYADVAAHVQVSTNLQTWTDNESTPGVTVEVSNVLQSDGTRIITARHSLPLSSSTQCFFKVIAR